VGQLEDRAVVCTDFPVAAGCIVYRDLHPKKWCAMYGSILQKRQVAERTHPLCGNRLVHPPVACFHGCASWASSTAPTMQEISTPPAASIHRHARHKAERIFL
jgi:hypothetical protein